MEVSSPAFPKDSHQPGPVAPQPAMDPRRSLTAAAYWVQLLYVPWIVVMFVLAYGVMSLLGAADETVKWTSQGALGWALTIAYAVVAALPNWLGAWLAVRARRGGAGSAATVALWQNLIVGLAFTVFVLIDMM